MQIGGVVVIEEVGLVLVLHKLEEGEEMGTVGTFEDAEGGFEVLVEGEGGGADEVLDVGAIGLFGTIEWVASLRCSVDNLHSIIKLLSKPPYFQLCHFYSYLFEGWPYLRSSTERVGE